MEKKKISDKSIFFFYRTVNMQTFRKNGSEREWGGCSFLTCLCNHAQFQTIYHANKVDRDRCPEELKRVHKGLWPWTGTAMSCPDCPEQKQIPVRMTLHGCNASFLCIHLSPHTPTEMPTIQSHRYPLCPTC